MDAFRVESLPESEQARRHGRLRRRLTASACWSPPAGALFLVSGFEGTGLPKAAAWTWGYVAMAGMVVIGTLAAALAATEPAPSRNAEAATAATARSAG